MLIELRSRVPEKTANHQNLVTVQMCFTSETWHMGFPSGEKLRVFHTDHWQAQGIIFKCARMPSPYPKRLATQTDVYIDIVLTINGTPDKNNHSSCIDIVDGSHISSQFRGQSPQIYTLIYPSVKYKDVHIVWQLPGPLLVELSDWSLAQVHFLALWPNWATKRNLNLAKTGGVE